MLDFVYNTLLQGVAVFICAKILPGARVSNFLHALLTALVLGILGALVGPVLVFVLKVLTFPINFLTLGLFGLVIVFVVNVIVLRITDVILTGLEIDGWTNTAIFALLLAVINTVLGWIF